MIVDLIDFLKKHLKAVRVFSIIAIATMLVWSYLGADNHHAHTWMEKYIPWFWSLFGFCSCCILIFFVKWFGNSGIQTREDFYDK